jgi:hypothetical protein
MIQSRHWFAATFHQVMDVCYAWCLLLACHLQTSFFFSNFHEISIPKFLSKMRRLWRVVWGGEREIRQSIYSLGYREMSRSNVLSYSMLGMTADKNLRKMNMYWSTRGSLLTLFMLLTIFCMTSACLQG